MSTFSDKDSWMKIKIELDKLYQKTRMFNVQFDTNIDIVFGFFYGSLN